MKEKGVHYIHPPNNGLALLNMVRIPYSYFIWAILRIQAFQYCWFGKVLCHKFTFIASSNKSHPNGFPCNNSAASCLHG